MTIYLPWLLLAAAPLFFAHAWSVLSADARGGYDVTMGGAGLFSGQWLLGSVAAAVGTALLPGTAWYWGVGLFVLLFLLKGIAYRVIVATNLGRDAPPPRRGGFKEFVRRGEEE